MKTRKTETTPKAGGTGKKPAAPKKTTPKASAAAAQPSEDKNAAAAEKVEELKPMEDVVVASVKVVGTPKSIGVKKSTTPKASSEVANSKPAAKSSSAAKKKKTPQFAGETKADETLKEKPNTDTTSKVSLDEKSTLGGDGDTPISKSVSRANVAPKATTAVKVVPTAQKTTPSTTKSTGKNTVKNKSKTAAGTASISSIPKIDDVALHKVVDHATISKEFKTKSAEDSAPAKDGEVVEEEQLELCSTDDDGHYAKEENHDGEDLEAADVMDNDEGMEFDEQEGFEEPDDEEDDSDEEEEDGGEMEEEQKIQMTEIANELRIKKAQEIFVGGLDRDAVEEDLEKAFEKIGEIIEVRLHKDFQTNKNKGFAFVKFATKEQATRALVEMKTPMIRGKRCGVAPSEDNDTLFLGNICNTWTKEAIRNKLKDYGIDGVESVTLVADTQNEGLSRGFAFVEFSCHIDAMNAYKRLQNPDVIFGHPERTAKVAFAEPLREPDEETMAQVKSVFVDGLPPHWDEDRVKERLKSYGEIERVVLARNMPSAKRKDFGFVNFTTHEAAVACAEALNDSELGDEKIKMKTKARLANPLPKTQAVKGGMRGGYRIGHTGLEIYSRFGRGFARGRHTFNRGALHRGRGFFPRGRARRFSYPFDEAGTSSFSNFRGRNSFISRGGRRGYFRGGRGAASEFSSRGSSFSARGSFVRGRGRYLQPQPQTYTAHEDFGGTYVDGDYNGGSYSYANSGHGLKRPFSYMDNDPSSTQPTSRLRERYDYSDPTYHRAQYQDHLETGGGSFHHDYYNSGPSGFGGGYASYYGQHSSGRGYYY